MRLPRLHSLATLVLGGLLAAAAWAAPAAPKDNAPAQSALPPGHPDISGMPGGAPKAADANRPALPPGHPDIAGVAGPSATSRPSQPAAQLPAGHPDIGGGNAPDQPATDQLPPGHPALPGLNPATRPAATHGTLFVRTAQGTRNGPAIGAAPVVVELYHRGRIIQTLNRTLDKNGAAVFDRLPLAVPVQPLVRVTYAGIDYEAVGELMDGSNAGQEVDLPVYETTDQTPPWSVYMRQVVVERVAEGVRVTEALAIQNPSDRTWIGTARRDGLRATMSVALPAGAARVDAGEYASRVKLEGGRLVSTLPVVPGTHSFQFSYVLAARDGKVRLDLVAPAAVGHMMVFVPDDGTAASAEGLKASGSHPINGGKALIFGGANLATNQRAAVNITLPPPMPPTPPARSASPAPPAGPRSVAGGK